MDRLLRLFALEQEGPTAFTGSGGLPMRRLFGGQVAAQSFVAAARTVDPSSGQRIHSLHGYFLRPGVGGTPIRFAVHSLKDGRNFAARDVVASQGEEVIFSLHASFTRPEKGISHLEAAMPDAPAPDLLDRAEAEVQPRPPEGATPAEAADFRQRAQMWLDSPVELRSCDPEPLDGRPLPSRRRVWIRAKFPLPDDPVLHAALVIWTSDRSLIRTGARPHGMRMRSAASLDHCMWFHDDVRFDDWWLYVMDSPVAHAARALIQGSMYRRDGTRVISVVQEGLIRNRE
jgi:acyl-CoA thioesterase-2